MNLKDRIAVSVAKGMRRFMSLDAAAEIYQPYDDFYYNDVNGGSTAAGKTVNVRTAQKLTVVNACVRILSDSIASLPANVYEKTDEVGSKQIARDHPLQRMIHFRPNEFQTPFEFKQEVISWLAARGNSYNEKIRSPQSRRVSQLWPINPDHLRADWLNRRSGRKRVYDVSSNHDGRARVLKDTDIWHPRLRSMDGGLTGASPIMLNAEGIGLALSSTEFAAKFFSNGARIAGFISPEDKLTDAQRREVAKSLNEQSAGATGHHTYKVYTRPMKFSEVSIGPEDAQLVEMMSWSIADLVRIWGVPLWLVQHEEKDSSWGSGIEQMGIGFDVYTLAPFVCAVEESMEYHLLEDPDRYFVELEMNALMRADIKARGEYYSKAVNANNPWLTRNDIRRDLSMQPDPSPEGDEFLRAKNNTGNDDNDQGANDDDAGSRVPLVPKRPNGQSGDVTHNA